MKIKKYSYILVLILVLVIGINGVFAAETTTCDALFGSPSDPESLRYFINKILVYPKVLVPIIVIGLGVLDLAKAVIASKEDEMRKAQLTLIKRVLIGVCIFFVPTIVNVLMHLADIVLNGTNSCGL